jgi:type II secretory pathway pseudopilin PulG
VRNKNQQVGMSLVEILIVVGVSSIFALIISTVISNMQTSFKRIEMRMNADIVNEYIKTLLLNRVACRNTFAPIGPLLPATTYTFTQIRDGNNAVRYDLNPIPDDPTVQIQEMQARNYVPATGKLTVDIKFRFLNTSIQPNFVQFSSDYDVTVDGTNTVTRCNSDKASLYDNVYINESAAYALETRNGDLTVVGQLRVNKDAGSLRGNVIAQAYYEVSDKRVKENIHLIEGALQKISQIRGVEFLWKSSQRKDWGVIAQEVENVAPFLVHNDENGYKSVNYNGLIALSIEAMKSLQKENQTLEQKIHSLNAQINEHIRNVCGRDSSYEFCQ